MASTVAATAPLSEHEHLRRAVIASTVGTAIEWYDFFLYGVVTRHGVREALLPDPLSDRKPARGARGEHRTYRRFKSPTRRRLGLHMASQIDRQSSGLAAIGRSRRMV
jgi:hypothetical protein